MLNPHQCFQQLTHVPVEVKITIMLHLEILVIMVIPGNIPQVLGSWYIYMCMIPNIHINTYIKYHTYVYIKTQSPIEYTWYVFIKMLTKPPKNLQSLVCYLVIIHITKCYSMIKYISREVKLYSFYKRNISPHNFV